MGVFFGTDYTYTSATPHVDTVTWVKSALCWHIFIHFDRNKLYRSKHFRANNCIFSKGLVCWDSLVNLTAHCHQKRAVPSSSHAPYSCQRVPAASLVPLLIWCWSDPSTGQINFLSQEKTKPVKKIFCWISSPKDQMDTRVGVARGQDSAARVRARRRWDKSLWRCWAARSVHHLAEPHAWRPVLFYL